MNNKKLTLTLALTVGFVSPTAPILATNISTTVLASGLNNPRGMTFGPDGQLYIAQAGRGGNGTCIVTGQSQVCSGLTSTIARLNTTTGATEVLIDNLPSSHVFWLGQLNLVVRFHMRRQVDWNGASLQFVVLYLSLSCWTGCRFRRG